MCHFCSAHLQPNCLIKLQFQDLLCTHAHTEQQLITPDISGQVCRLVKLKFRNCLKHRFRRSQLMHDHPQQ